MLVPDSYGSYTLSQFNQNIVNTLPDRLKEALKNYSIITTPTKGKKYYFFALKNGQSISELAGQPKPIRGEYMGTESGFYRMKSEDNDSRGSTIKIPVGSALWYRSGLSSGLSGVFGSKKTSINLLEGGRRRSRKTVKRRRSNKNKKSRKHRRSNKRR